MTLVLIHTNWSLGLGLRALFCVFGQLVEETRKPVWTENTFNHRKCQFTIFYEIDNFDSQFYKNSLQFANCETLFHILRWPMMGEASFKM